MGENKKYYWLKLHKDFFNQKEIKYLRRIAGGDVYTIIYLKMLLFSLDTNGMLYYDGYYDTFADELAVDIDESPDNVKVVVKFLIEKGLMEVHDDDTFLLTKCQEMTGSETGSAARMRKMRKKKTPEQLPCSDKPLQCNNKPSQCDAQVSQCYSDVTSCYTEIEKEKEKEKEKDKKIDKEKILSDFEELWSMYPNKKGKTEALKKYKSLAEKGKVTKEQVAEGIRRYCDDIKAKNTSIQYVKHGSSWFNQECWNDEYESTKKAADYSENFSLEEYARSQGYEV